MPRVDDIGIDPAVARAVAALLRGEAAGYGLPPILAHRCTGAYGSALFRCLGCGDESPVSLPALRPGLDDDIVHSTLAIERRMPPVMPLSHWCYARDGIFCDRQ